ncbi:MAG: YeeE/YedE family protein [Rhodospirillales bacterium]|nr:YeeE/YedE family protein [Rhodospirillales bacterium]
MSFESIADLFGEQWLGPLGGLAIGVAFGFLAQRSAFCLRAATLEVAHGTLGERLAVWLLTFSTALIATQALLQIGLFDTGAVRQLNNRGSLSGAIIGGLLFGSGMVLTRACASRMLVLSATGNLRALLSGLVFAVVAQSSRTGILEPLRAALGDIWTISPEARDMLAFTGAGHAGAMAFGSLWLILGIGLAVRNRVRPATAAGAAGVGLCVATAWWFTFGHAAISFDPVSVHSLSFTGPSADMLMFVVARPEGALTFDLGLLPGVVAGAALGGLVGREMRLEGFEGGAAMRRYIAGGCLMGFGGTLAGGCAVGAGVSGASIFAFTAWIVLWSMWIGAVLTDWFVDQPARRAGSAGGLAAGRAN